MATPITYQTIQTTKGIIQIPIFALADVVDSSYRVRTHKGVGCYDLVTPTNETPIRVRTHKGIRGINLQTTQEELVTTDLIAHYDFRGRSNSDSDRQIATDLSGNGRNGTLTNFKYIAGSGYQGGGLKFDGINNFIELNTPGIMPNGMTLEFVVDKNLMDINLETHFYEGQVRYLEVSPGAPTRRWFEIMTENLSGSNTWIGTQVPAQTLTNIKNDPNRFLHVTASISIGTVGKCIYMLNGVTVYENTHDVNLRQRDTAKIGTGLEMYNPMNLYAFRLYNRALSKEEMLQNYRVTRKDHI